MPRRSSRLRKKSEDLSNDVEKEEKKSRRSSRSRKKRKRSPSPSPEDDHDDSEVQSSKKVDFTTDTKNSSVESGLVESSGTKENVEMDEDLELIPSAKTTESNGEISCSIEETNRVRLQLGLKPLKVSTTMSKKEKEERAFAEKLEKEKLAQQSQEFKDRISKVRSKRQSHSYLSSKTKLSELGDGDEELSSAKSWIENRMKLGKTSFVPTILQDDENNENDEMEIDDNLGISHDMSSDLVGEGETTILTLKDSSLLETNNEGEKVSFDLI